MNPDTDRLIHDFLDDRLSDEQLVELNVRIRNDPRFAMEFAQALYLHDRLFDLARTSPSDGRIPQAISMSQRHSERLPIPRRFRFWGILAAGIACLAFTTFWNASRTLNAATEIDRLIATVKPRTDRRYVIRNLDGVAEPNSGRQPPIDGATLDVRSPDRYVLERHFADGRRFLTGSDGESSWAIPPDGPVRISHDPERFRGPVPGHQHGLPFVDVQSDLVTFRNSYDLDGPFSGTDGSLMIRGTRKPGIPRGPRAFEMTYEPETGTIRRMLFDGLPQARGGPRRVAVELTDSEQRPEAFFDHKFHHANDREIIEEP